MARFRGTVLGSRGGASRLGGTDSGLYTQANGWRGGVSVVLYDRDGADHARVSLTGGSNGAGLIVVLYDGLIDVDTRFALDVGKWAGTDVRVKLHRPVA